MIKPLRIIFAGTPEFAVPALLAILQTTHQICCVYTQPDRPAGRGRKLTASPVKKAALEQGLPICQPVSLRQPEAQQQLKSWQADLMIVAAYGLIFPVAILEIPRFGCINIHASLLPRWRGAAPIQRAILAGDTATGITIMQMAAGLDTGAMLAKLSCPITVQDTSQTLHDRLAKLGAEGLLDILVKLQHGILNPEQQDEQQSCYAAKFEKSEALIEWHQSTLYLDRLIRAFNPWPVAYTLLSQEPIKIWQAQEVAISSSAQPGTIIAVSKAGIDVKTGDGALRLTTIQLPGGRLVTAPELLNSHKNPLSAGTVFT